MKRIGLFLLGIVIIATTSSVMTSSFARAEQGVINAMAFKNLPASKVIQVQAMDNSDDNLVLLGIFETALKKQGYTISADAPVTLTFDIRSDIGAWSTKNPALFELSLNGGRTGGERAKAKINLFDSANGGLLNNTLPDTSIVTPSRYQIDTSVEDSRSGKRYWQAWTKADLGTYDRLALTREMVPVIVQGIGKTMRRERFELP